MLNGSYDMQISCQKQNSRFPRDFTALRSQFRSSVFSFHRCLVNVLKEMRSSF